MREGETVAPEEPLEVDDGHGQHGEHDERERRLPAREARVEEAHARDHEEHEGRRGEDPGEVTALDQFAFARQRERPFFSL